MKLYIERRDGMLRIQQKLNMRPPDKREWIRTYRVVEDTPENYKDILRWADLMEHMIEKK